MDGGVTDTACGIETKIRLNHLYQLVDNMDDDVDHTEMELQVLKDGPQLQFAGLWDELELSNQLTRQPVSDLRPKTDKVSDKLKVQMKKNKHLKAKLDEEQMWKLQLQTEMKNTEILAKESQSLAKKIESLTTENKSLSEENESLRKENESLDTENESLTKKNKSLTEEKESLTIEKELLTKEKDSLKKEKEFFNTKNESLTKEKASLSAENESLTNVNEFLTNEYESLNNENNCLTKMNQSLTQDKELLTKERESLTKDRDCLAAALKEGQAWRREFSQEMKRVRADNLKLQSQNSVYTQFLGGKKCSCSKRMLHFFGFHRK
uniref:immunoglobulin G-binding protein H-like n=1 Tax=Solea senegalensis TaxID=28829 RepID=UPI001CD83F64|nr:immunoglobulin G-binding protein H-like [Solea senegalensis]